MPATASIHHPYNLSNNDQGSAPPQGHFGSNIYDSQPLNPSSLQKSILLWTQSNLDCENEAVTYSTPMPIPSEGVRTFQTSKAPSVLETGLTGDEVIPRADNTENTNLVTDSSADGRLVGIIVETKAHEGYGYKVVMVNPVICGFCEKPYATEQDLRKHMKKLHSTEMEQAAGKKSAPVLCGQCDVYLMNDINLRRHIAIAHKEGAITHHCLTCGAPFSSRHAYAKHRKDVHSIEPQAKKKNRNRQNGLNKDSQMVDLLKVYMCDNCEHHTKNKANLVRHIDNQHLKLRQFECTECGEKFKTKHNMQCHQTSKTCERVRERASSQVCEGGSSNV